ncbi:DUF4863 family protein [Ideonella sp. 4Y16]|uniref:4-hydroxylaminobenzoate lyase n=1 Tax=Ideonella alba TaxID=2824118 RepID=UPI001B372927|nr:DUF4863 family protein [Ideonella alba]MBQ0944411.1 DUF4863 family protein [Ideonella alba]
MSTVDTFQDLIAPLTASLAGRPLDEALAAELNRTHPAGSPLFEAIVAACRAGDAAGWICPHEHGGIRYGRVIKPTPALNGFSVDVVDMRDVVGPHHVHPNGEIDLVMPLDGDARFDGQAAGWKVYPPGSAHRPTVTGGRAYVLYLLPEGAIQFTKA